MKTLIARMFAIASMPCLILASSIGERNSQAQDRKVIYQINCGGPAVGSYSADKYFEGGSKYDNNDGVDTTDVRNGPPAKVYNTQRYGDFLYVFPDLKPSGNYVVRLYFAEIYFNKGQVAKRVFNVSINRKNVLDHYEILAEVGEKDRAIVKEFNVQADDTGYIRIAFESLVTNATVNAIEINEGGSSSPTNSTPVKTSPARTETKSDLPPTQQSCTQETASHTLGDWVKDHDDLANADNTFPKAQYPSLLKKADQVIALLKQSVPKLTGAEGHPYRSISGQPYVANGPVPFGVNVPIFDYYCIPVTSGAPELRGKVKLTGETGTWIYFYFNSLGWLAQNSLAVRTVNGARIFLQPKQSDEELKGYPLLLPELNVGRPDEAIVITPDGHSPFKPLSREKFLVAEQKYYQNEVDKVQKLSPVPASVLASVLTQRQNELAAITNLLNSMSQADKESQAIVRLPVNPRGKIFVTEAEGGRPLVTIDAKLFAPTSSRTAVKIITVYWETDKANVAKAHAIRDFKNNFDFQALRQMLDQ